MPKIRLISILLLLSGTALTQAVTFTSNTVIDAGNTTYDGQDIIIDGCTLTVNGVHNFNSLQLINAGLVTHSAASTGQRGNRINLTVTQDTTIDVDCKISADGKGYGSGSGPGAGGTGNSGGGAGYGGSGGRARSDGTGGLPYGSIAQPNALGSGGGRSTNWNRDGGPGGGVIRLTVGGTLTVEGSLTANGSDVHYAGSGSGGSIYVTAGTLAGGGIISANGGNDTYNYGGGGGGGRVAVYYLQANSFGLSRITANGGTGYESGKSGSVFLFGPNAPILISDTRVSPIAIDVSENETTTFSYAVNMDAQVTIRIYRLDIRPDPYYWQPFDVTKTLVATPANGISAVTGINSFLWNGNDDFDVPLPSGAYAYTIDAEDRDGKKASYDPEYTPQAVSLRNMTVSENFLVSYDN